MKPVFLIFFTILSYSCSSNDQLMILENGIHFYHVTSPDNLNKIYAGSCNDIALRAFEKSGHAICGIDVTDVARQCPQGIRCERIEYGFEESKLSYANYIVDKDGLIKLSAISSKTFGDPEISEFNNGSTGTMAALVITKKSWELGDKAFTCRL